MPFFAPRCYGNTSDQNKALRIRQLRSERSEREEGQALPDLRPDDWPANGREPIVYENRELLVNDGRQWAFNVHKGALRRRPNLVRWSNVGVRGEYPMLKWGSREYNVDAREILDCDYTDIAQEHGAYISPSGSTKVARSTFLRCGSQGLQFAHRPNAYQQYSADNMPYAKPPVHEIDDCHFVDCGTGGTRPSFSLTYFDPGSSEYPGTVRVTNSSFVADWSEPGPKGNLSTGAFVMTPSQGGPDIVPEMGDMLQSTSFVNCVFDYTKGDRPLGAIRASTNILFEQSCFIAREHLQPWIDIDDGGTDRLHGMKSKRITIRDCVSRGVKLRVWGAGDWVIATVDLHCPGGEIHINGMTGEVRRTA